MLFSAAGFGGAQFAVADPGSVGARAAAGGCRPRTHGSPSGWILKELVWSSFFSRSFQALREENDKLKGQVVVAEALQASVSKVLERGPLTTTQG